MSDPRALVQSLYRGILRRPADADGLAHFAGQLQSGRPVEAIVQDLLKSEEFRQQTAVRTFVPPGHFYSPIVNPAEIEAYVAGVESAEAETAIPGIPLDRAEVVGTWNKLVPFMLQIPFGDTKRDGLRYAFDNDAYAWGDGSVLYAMLRWLQPKRVIEIGSGWSSACALDTSERHLGSRCHFTFIEPYPQLVKSLIGGGYENATIIDRPVQSVPLAVFDDLADGDILFIDSTHIVKTGSDCCYELFEVLPRLKRGVVVHIHDIFWPFEYPRLWTINENRSWNEIYAVRALLTDNRCWEIIMFNDYIMKVESQLVQKTYPAFARGSGAAMWMRKRW